ncbi:MAG: sulfite exporter TauE/SafE family protein [Intrasporangium sp.]|uniref:sulfite exporter TauE/SafE family protein n=1 Tax=Intrasporangium sp. TaxID=1925024 RepID=UPI0026485B6C|nr:sulfite exporter TauE/SafE family protein [Intrasporangium sp.]MDN5797478.1 sulfite exporter TauE/SafE family protein [Intrasporangium sp.]
MIVVLLVVAAFIVGFSKTAIGGLAMISVAIYAGIMPARESTAALLLVLIIGDVFAVWHYRKECDWAILRRLVPAVLPGIVLGAVFLAVVDDAVLRRSIGAILLALALHQLWLLRRRTRPRRPVTRATGPPAQHSWLAAAGAGIGAGFTTMAANAGGGVMTLYLTAQGVDKLRFLGTSALFFFGINLSKLPFSAALGLFSRPMFLQALWLAPVVVLGAWIGLHAARRISETWFSVAVVAVTAISAVPLLIG